MTKDMTSMTSLQNILELKHSETPFHMVAEPARLACSPSTTRAGANDIDPSSTSPLGPTSSTSPITSTQFFEHHWYGIPRSHRPSPTTSPSSSSGGHPPEYTDEQLDNIYNTRPRHLPHLRGVLPLASGGSSHSSPTSSPRHAVTAAATTAAAAATATAASTSRPATLRRNDDSGNIPHNFPGARRTAKG